MLPRIAEKGKGFVFVWLDGFQPDGAYSDGKWELDKAFAEVSAEDPRTTSHPDYTVKVVATYRDSAHNRYRSSAALNYIASQDRLAFGPTVHERVEPSPVDAPSRQPFESPAPGGADSTRQPFESPAPGGADSTHADSLDFSELPQSARDLIAADEIGAQAILEGFQQDQASLISQAHRLGVSPSGIDFAPGIWF
jgi:hypothetical protein